MKFTEPMKTWKETAELCSSPYEAKLREEGKSYIQSCFFLGCENEAPLFWAADGEEKFGLMGYIIAPMSKYRVLDDTTILGSVSWGTIFRVIGRKMIGSL